MKETEDVAGPQMLERVKMNGFGPETERQEVIFSYSMKETEDVAGPQKLERLKMDGFGPET